MYQEQPPRSSHSLSEQTLNLTTLSSDASAASRTAHSTEGELASVTIRSISCEAFSNILLYLLVQGLVAAAPGSNSRISDAGITDPAPAPADNGIDEGAFAGEDLADEPRGRGVEDIASQLEDVIEELYELLCAAGPAKSTRVDLAALFADCVLDSSVSIGFETGFEVGEKLRSYRELRICNYSAGCRELAGAELSFRKYTGSVSIDLEVQWNEILLIQFAVIADRTALFNEVLRCLPKEEIAACSVAPSYSSAAKLESYSSAKDERFSNLPEFLTLMLGCDTKNGIEQRIGDLSSLLDDQDFFKVLANTRVSPNEIHAVDCVCAANEWRLLVVTEVSHGSIPIVLPFTQGASNEQLRTNYLALREMQREFLALPEQQQRVPVSATGTLPGADNCEQVIREHFPKVSRRLVRALCNQDPLDIDDLLDCVKPRVPFRVANATVIKFDEDDDTAIESLSYIAPIGTTKSEHPSFVISYEVTTLFADTDSGDADSIFDPEGTTASRATIELTIQWPTSPYQIDLAQIAQRYRELQSFAACFPATEVNSESFAQYLPASPIAIGVQRGAQA